jgi:signal transduction histidine kinase
MSHQVGSAQASIQRHVDGLARLVDDSIDLSRIATGRTQLHRDRIDLRVVVVQAIRRVAPQMQARRHCLTTALPDTPVWLVADTLRLEQLFVELLDNAAKYTEPGGRVSVWMRSADQQATVRIRDTGVGISRQLLPHVFDRFGQAEEAPSCSGSPPGAGLAVVRDLVEKHDGSVTADSRGCGCGSVFTVRLPRGD